MKTVFVTVGTTKFDQLTEGITSPENVQVRKCLKRWNAAICSHKLMLTFTFISMSLIWPYVLHLYTAEQQNINVKYQPAKKRNV